MDPQIFRKSLKYQANLLASKWLGQPNMSRKKAFEIMGDFGSILQQKTVTLLICAILQRLSELGENLGNVNAFQQMFNDLQNPFADINTEHKCLMHFEKDLGVYIPPQEVIVDTKDYCSQLNNTDPLENEKVSFEFIPLQESFKKFFEIPGILKSTISYLVDLENDDSILSNCVQTEHWKTKKRAFGNRLVLPLYIYWDEYETNNPLGSHKGEGKVGAVYVVIACLHPQIRSQVENIFVLTLFKSVDLEKIPLFTFFSKLVCELNFLEKIGIIVSTPNGFQQIFFSVEVIIGDNLALHAVLGFTTGFTATYPCRFCHVNHTEMNLIVKESQCKLRDEQSYARDLLADDLKNTGIVKQSALSDLKSRSTLELMSVDPAHDILEGVLEYDIGLIMHQFIEIDHFFTLTELNYRIRNFDYGPNDTNKPRPIKLNQIKNKHIKMSASEALCFIRNLGLLIGDLIPRANLHWELLIALKEIVDIVSSPVVSLEILNFMETLVADYLGKLNYLFKDSIKPKHHLLVHYASVSRRFGPVWNLSTLRCESVNSISKIASRESRNKVNITKTIAIKCQLQASDRYLRHEKFELECYKYQTSNTLPVIDLPDIHLYFPLLADIAPRDNVKKLDSIYNT